MIIGTFMYDAKADRYRGQIQTLTLSRDGIEFRPQTRNNDREPDYRIMQVLPAGEVELGAAWQRRTDRQKEYLSVLLDDPALEKTLSAALFPDRDGKANLVWSRPSGREAAPKQRPSGRSRGPAVPSEPAQS